ncbi:MAG: hypothetical protein KJ630_19135 [Proteobacteria bacterium]|nr:hypothetical protein [Pseudomonadota bacterium]
MAVTYTVTAGYFPIPSPKLGGYARKDTLIINKISAELSIISNTIFFMVQRYSWSTAVFPNRYVKDTYGTHYVNPLTGTFVLYSTLPASSKENSFLPVPNTHYGIATWTTKTYVTGSSYYEEGLSDIRPSIMTSTGVFEPSLNPGAPGVIAYAGGEFTVPDSAPNTIATQSGETASTIRRTLSFPVAAGQYEVRLRRVSPDTDSNRIADSVVWTALRSHQVGAAITEPLMARTALRIRATEQLNGSIENYNCIAQTVCQDYDIVTDTWVERATSNPASLYRFVLQGPANKRPLIDDQIDLDSLEEWHTLCEDENFEFNHYVDYRSSVDTVLKMIAAAGRAAPGYIDGKYGVVMDRVQTNIAQHFTPRNSWDYSYNKIFFDRPHAFRVKFWNRDNDWREDERIVYDDGYTAANATKFEELTLPGVTSSWEAYKHGRYHIATARLRPETHTFNTDFEYLTCTRGDRIKFTNDVISVGIGYGRVKSYTDDGTNVLTISVDELLPMESGKTYQFRIRQHDGTSLSVNLTTAAGTWKEFSVSDTLAIASAPDIDALAMYGETDEESIDLIVKNITPTSDLTAILTCLAYAPEVHEAHLGTIPTFDTHTSTPVDLATIYKPSLSLRSDETAILVDRSSGTVALRIIATADTQQVPTGIIDKMLVRCRRYGSVNPWDVIETTTNEAAFSKDIVRNVRYEIQACYFMYGKQGLWCNKISHIVDGMSAMPSDVTGFNSSVTSFGGIILEWTDNTDLDLSHYVIRYSSAVTAGATWENSIELAKVYGNTVTLPAALDGTYFIKAVDLDNRSSENAALLITTIPSLIAFNAMEEVNDGTTWDGVKESCYINNGQLIMDMAGEWDGITDFDAWTGIDSYGGAVTDAYYYPSEIVGLGSSQTARCGITFDFYGINSEDLWDDIQDFDDVTDFSALVPGVGIQPQISLSDDSITWTDWKPFVNGDYTSQYFKFRLYLSSTITTNYVVVNQFLVSVDMPDRAERGQDIAIPTGGDTISFTTPYMVAPIVRATIDSATSGDTLKITSVTTTGFNAQVLNAGSGVARTIDWQSVGY